MVNTISGDLRAWRTDSALSLGKLAKRAGIGKATISRWEAGTHTPRPTELCAVLDVLGVTGAKRARHLSRYAPLAIAPVLKSSLATALLPSVGELLYALRLRAGLSQADAARRAGIGQTLLSRWERGASLPSDAERHMVCFALGASVDEAVALITQPCAEDPLPGDFMSLIGRFHVLRCNVPPHETETALIAYAAQMGRLVRRGAAEKFEMLPIWAEQMRIAQDKAPGRPLSAPFVTRTRELLRTFVGDFGWGYVAPALQSFDTGDDPAVRLAEMQEWIPRFTEPAARAFFLNGVAKVARTVDKAYTLRLLDEITEVSACVPQEFPIRMGNRANHLLEMGEPAAALAVLERYEPYQDTRGFLPGLWELTRAQACAALGDRAGASAALPLARAALLPNDADAYGAEIAKLERFLNR